MTMLKLLLSIATIAISLARSTIVLNDPRPGLVVGNLTLSYDFSDGWIVNGPSIGIRDHLYLEKGVFSAPWHLVLGLQQLGTPEALFVANETDYAHRLGLKAVNTKGFRRSTVAHSDVFTIEDFQTMVHEFMTANKHLIDMSRIKSRFPVSKTRDPQQPQDLELRALASPSSLMYNCESERIKQKAKCHKNHAASRKACREAIKQIPCNYACGFGQCVVVYGECSVVLDNNSLHNSGGFSSLDWRLGANAIWEDCFDHAKGDVSGTIDAKGHHKVCICNNANIGSC